MKTKHSFIIGFLVWLLFTTMLVFETYAQTQKVIRVNNATVRFHIERFTEQYTFPDVIKFVQDGNGNWITSIENLENARYVGIRNDLIQYMRDNNITTTAKSIRELLQNFGAQIDYVKPANSEP